MNEQNIIMASNNECTSIPPRRGHWIRRKKWDMYVCSNCSFEFEIASNICPNCGADMREVENRNDDN